MRSLPLLLLLACEPSPWQWATTPVGYLAGWKYEPAPAEALDDLDRAIDSAIVNLAINYNYSVPSMLQMMDQARFYLFPGPFETDDSPTGWASGQALWGSYVLAWRVPGNPLPYPALEAEIRHNYERSWTVGH